MKIVILLCFCYTSYFMQPYLSVFKGIYFHFDAVNIPRLGITIIRAECDY